ncbi:unnamed protein product, partial [Rotaria sp. Silwood1]
MVAGAEGAVGAPNEMR